MFSRRWLSPIVFTFLFILPLSLFAQITDTVLFYDFGLTSRLSIGNQDQVLISTNLRLEKSNRQWGFRFSSNTFHMWINDRRLDNDFYQDLVLYHRPFQRFSPYLISRYEESQRRGLESKLMGGAGLSYQAITQADHRLRVSANLVYVATSFDQSELRLLGDIGDRDRQLVRGTLFIVGRHRFLERNLQLRYVWWLQSAIDQLNDHRLQLNLHLDERVYKQLFFRLSLFYFYETVLPVNRDKGDLRLSFGVAWKRA